jgi:1-acyl-sn-glycerol-3-phosphate acyltransferase
MSATSPELAVPRRVAPGRGLRRRVAGIVLRVGGFQPEGPPPELPRYVIVAAPHTYFWDTVWMLAFAWWWGLHLRWLVKRSIAVGPLGWWLKRLGAVPVDRSTPTGLVEDLANVIRDHDEMVLAIAPEATRARGQWWRSGFYQIARQADVPICLSYLDYQRRRGGFGPCFRLSGDVVADMNAVRDFYRGVHARYPERFTPPRLREEEEPAR